MRSKRAGVRPDGGGVTMSLTADRICELILDAKLDDTRITEVAQVLRATGHYGSEANGIVADVLAAAWVLTGPDASKARNLAGLVQPALPADESPAVA